MTEALRRIWAKDLDAATLYKLLKLRVEVFVVEQAAPYPELDGRDLLAETRHFWLDRPEGPEGEVISTLRLMEEHPGGEEAVRIGPGCTKRSARGPGHASWQLRPEPTAPAWSRCRWAPPRTGWSARWICSVCCATASTPFRRGSWPAPMAACSTSTRSTCCTTIWSTCCSTPRRWDGCTSNA